MSELPASLQKIVGAFQMVPDPMARYKQLLFYATKLEKLPDELHTSANKVEGCVSQVMQVTVWTRCGPPTWVVTNTVMPSACPQVWVVPELREDGRIYWRADSDSQLTKGLAALLVNGLSGCTPDEILKVQVSGCGWEDGNGANTHCHVCCMYLCTCSMPSQLPLTSCMPPALVYLAVA
jgi:sulfur transfer protein SufE